MKRRLLSLLLAALLLLCACGKRAEGEKDARAEDSGAEYASYAENGRYGGRELLKEAVICTARAYYAHRADIEYDDLLMGDGQRYEFALPEEASYQRKVFFNGPSFCRNVYKTAFDYIPPDLKDALSPDFSNEHGERILFTGGFVTAEEKKKQEALLKNTLQCGDIIYCRSAEKEEAWLCLDGGEVMYCSFTPTGGSYDYDLSHDKIEVTALFLTTVDELLLKNDLFAENNALCVLRPFERGLAPNENTLARLSSLSGVCITKVTSAPKGVSVSPGGSVEITLTVRNTDKTEKTVTVFDEAPPYSYLETNEPFPMTLSLKSGESKSVKYAVRIDENCVSGTRLDLSNAEINGMKTGNTPVLVGNTLTQDEQESITALKISSLSAKSEGALIAEIYLSALSKSLQAPSPSELLSAVFLPVGDAEEARGVTPGVTGSAFSRAFVSGMYGGKNCFSDNNGDRTRKIRNLNLIPGDIVAFSPDGKKAAAFVYLGQGEAAVILSGKAVKADSAGLLDKLFGQYCFCVIRPSFIF